MSNEPAINHFFFIFSLFSYFPFSCSPALLVSRSLLLALALSILSLPPSFCLYFFLLVALIFPNIKRLVAVLSVNIEFSMVCFCKCRIGSIQKWRTEKKLNIPFFSQAEISNQLKNLSDCCIQLEWVSTRFPAIKSMR